MPDTMFNSSFFHMHCSLHFLIHTSRHMYVHCTLYVICELCYLSFVKKGCIKGRLRNIGIYYIVILLNLYFYCISLYLYRFLPLEPLSQINDRYQEEITKKICLLTIATHNTRHDSAL